MLDHAIERGWELGIDLGVDGEEQGREGALACWHGEGAASRTVGPGKPGRSREGTRGMEELVTARGRGSARLPDVSRGKGMNSDEFNGQAHQVSFPGEFVVDFCYSFPVFLLSQV